jgi:hypothetical protein
VVDEAAHPEINALDALQGPVPEPAGGAFEEEWESEDEGGEFRALPRSTELARVIEDAGQATAAFWAEVDAGHLPAMTNDAEIYRSKWQHEFGQPGEPPPAFYDAGGNLHVDMTRVDVHTRPR